jgi:alcohol dehydrogenase
VRIESGTRAALVGAGRLGLLVAQVLRAHGASVTVITRSATSRALAAALGFETVTVDSARASLARRFDVVVEATGEPAGFAAASALVRPRGTLVIKSTFHGETPIAFSPLVVDEITVIGSRCGPFARAIELLDDGRVEVKPLVAGVYPLAQFEEAFDRAKRGLKVILIPAR